MKRLAYGLVALAIIAMAVAGFKWLRDTRPQPEKQVLAHKVWPVAAQRVRLVEVRPERSVFAEVKLAGAPRLVQAPFAAWVRQVHVTQDAAVSKGAPLVTLDVLDARAALNQAEAEVARLRAQIAAEQAQLKARQDLARRKLAGELDIEVRRQSLAGLKAQLARAEAVLAQRRRDAASPVIRAEGDLRVTAVKVAPGQRVSAGAVLMEGHAPGDLRLRVVLPDGLWRQVAGRADQLSLKTEAGTFAFERLAQQVTPLGKPVWFCGPVAALRLGDLVTGTLQLPPVRQAALLPFSALYGTDHLYLIENGHLRRRPVTLLGQVRREGRSLAVVQGVPEGAQVLTTHLPNAIDGLAVKVAGGHG